MDAKTGFEALRFFTDEKHSFTSMDDNLLRNHDIIGRLLQWLRGGMEPIVRRNFPDQYADDVSILLKFFAHRLDEFSEDLPRKVRTYSHELMDVRNEWAHQKPFSDEDTLRALDSGERLLNELGEKHLTGKIRESKTVLARGNERSIAEVSVIRPPKTFKVASKKSVAEDLQISTRLLKDLKFSGDNDTRDYQRLKERFNEVTHQVFGVSDVKSGRYPRTVIPLDFGFAREARIEPGRVNSEDFIKLVLHLGDTKEQARKLFDLNPQGISWPNDFLGFDLTYNPYLRIADAYGSTLFWIRPTLEEARLTHTRQLFDELAGKVKREEWEYFYSVLSKYVVNWRNKCFESDKSVPVSWDNKIVSSNRKEFVFSVGMNLLVSMPYGTCQTLDDSKTDSGLSRKIKEIILYIKNKT